MDLQYISEAKAKQGTSKSLLTFYVRMYDTTQIKHNQVILHLCTKNTYVAVGTAQSKSSEKDKALSYAKLKSLILPTKQRKKNETETVHQLLTRRIYN